VARGPLRVTRAGRSPVIHPWQPGTLEFALRSIRGGKTKFMDLASQAIQFDDRVELVVQQWNRLTAWQRRITPLEDLCEAADITPGEFLGVVVRAAFEFSRDIAPLLVAAAFPGVVQSTIQRAKTINGHQDRRILFEHVYQSTTEG